MQKYLTPREVARLTGFSPQKVRHLIQAGLLPAKDTSSGARPRYLIRNHDLESFLTPDSQKEVRHAGA
ncbi:MAG: helix-turn-helix domain-containing protein [Pirellulaceae bacterium]|nr:helix-turn-helix domain-containing protein [Pirellulaceae bacterium]